MRERERFRATVLRPDSAFLSRVIGWPGDARVDERLSPLRRLTPAMRELERELPRRLTGEWARLAARFPALDTTGVVVYLLPSLGAFDAQVRPDGERLVLLFGLDVIAAQHGSRVPAATIQHELFHVYHQQRSPEIRAGAAAFFERGHMPRLHQLLWVEGLAVHASRVLAPDAADRELFNDDSLRARTSAVEATLARELLAKLDSTDPQDVRTFFLLREGGRGDVPVRAGYYMGFRVAEHLAGLHTLDDLVRLSGSDLREAVAGALRYLAAGGPR